MTTPLIGVGFLLTSTQYSTCQRNPLLFKEAGNLLPYPKHPALQLDNIVNRFNRVHILIQQNSTNPEAGYPYQLGPSRKFVENSTKLTCLEIIGYRIKHSTVLWLVEIQIRPGRKVQTQVHSVNSNGGTANCQCRIFKKKNPVIRIFYISRWLAVPLIRISGVLLHYHNQTPFHFYSTIYVEVSQEGVLPSELPTNPLLVNLAFYPSHLTPSPTQHAAPIPLFSISPLPDSSLQRKGLQMMSFLTKYITY